MRMQADGGVGGYLTRTLRQYDVEGTIIFGGISEISERPFGSLTLELSGDQGKIEALVRHLTTSASAIDLGTAVFPRDLPDYVHTEGDLA